MKSYYCYTYVGTGNDEEVFADGKVIYAGQLVGMVVAETRMQARRAAKAVSIIYEDLPTVLNIEVSSDHECILHGGVYLIYIYICLSRKPSLPTSFSPLRVA